MPTVRECASLLLPHYESASRRCRSGVDMVGRGLLLLSDCDQAPFEGPAVASPRLCRVKLTQVRFRTFRRNVDVIR